MKIDKPKLGNSLQFKNLSNVIYCRTEAINKLLDELCILHKENTKPSLNNLILEKIKNICMKLRNYSRIQLHSKMLKPS